MSAKREPRVKRLAWVGLTLAALAAYWWAASLAFRGDVSGLAVLTIVVLIVDNWQPASVLRS